MEPLYMYYRGNFGDHVYLVYTEEEKHHIQRQMREDGCADEYVWYSLQKVEG